MIKTNISLQVKKSCVPLFLPNQSKLRENTCTWGRDGKQ